MASLEAIQGTLPSVTSPLPTSNAIKDLIAGTAGGIAQTLVAQPVSTYLVQDLDL